MLAAVYSEEKEREQQASRLKALLNNPAAERLFFVVAKQHTMTVAFLQLSRERKNHCCFRIRGLYTHPNFRNRSLATRLLQLACKCVAEFLQGEAIFSFVLPTNLPSLAAHEQAGFFPAVMQGMQPERHLCLAWTRQDNIL